MDDDWHHTFGAPVFLPHDSPAVTLLTPVFSVLNTPFVPNVVYIVTYPPLPFPLPINRC